MSTSETAAHLNFLTDAAHLLAFTAPETSSYLMRRRNGLMIANDLDQSDTQREHVCTSCGRIMVPGQNSTLKFETEKALRTKRRRDTGTAEKPRASAKSNTRSGPTKVFTCENCGRYTRIQLPAPGPIIRRKPSTLPLTRTTEAPKQPPSANASSKKRAKNRKAGLQALLNQNQASSSGVRSGLGLSLSDFMKK